MRDGQRLLAYKLATGRVSSAGTLPDPADITTELETGVTGSIGIVLPPVGDQAVLGNAAPSPDGALAGGAETTVPGASPVQLQVFSGSQGFTDTFRDAVIHTPGRLVDVRGLPPDSCDQISWLNAGAVLCDNTFNTLGHSSQLYSIPRSAATRTTTAPPPSRQRSAAGARVAAVTQTRACPPWRPRRPLRTWDPGDNQRA